MSNCCARVSITTSLNLRRSPSSPSASPWSRHPALSICPLGTFSDMTGEQKLEGIAARLRHAGFSCEFQANEKTMLCSKLAFLAPFALIGTASDKDKPGIFADATWRGRLESAVGEG